MMKRLISSTLLLLGAVWTAACEPPPSPEPSPALSEELRQRVDQFVTERMSQGHVPGLSLVVVKDGEPVYVKGYGSENVETGRPMTEHSLVSLGSTTKAMTALALMQLVEQGRVDVEAPVTRYLPWFQTADGQGGSILVKHLLSHSSGLPASFVWDGATDDGALERRVRALASVQLRFPPGSSWEYANDGFAVLGLIVQAVSGMAYEDYMALHVFQPLGLEHTSFGALPARDVALSQGYVWTRGEVRPMPAVMSRAQHPAGTALFSSAEDVARYLVALVGKGQGSGERVLSTGSVDRMWQPLVPGYGMGWFVSPLFGRLAVSHGGDVITHGSRFVVLPEERLAVATLSNLDTGTKDEIADGVTALLLGEEPPPAATSLKQRAPSIFVPDTSVWQRYTGSYVSPMLGKMDVYVEQGRLMLSLSLAEPHFLTELEPYGDNEFVLRNDYGTLEGSVVTFDTRTEGQVSMFLDGQPYAQRQP